MMENRESIKRIIDVIPELSKAGVVKPRKMLSFKLGESMDDAKSIIMQLAPQLDSTINKLIWLEEYDKICAWMIAPEKGLSLIGAPGRLKSVIGTMILPVLYKSFYGLNIKPVDSYMIHEHFNELSKHPIIIIDDVGEEPPVNDFGSKHEPFSRLVDYCEKNSRVLIITSNLSSNELISRYGVRPVDRLDKLCTPVLFKGKSYRK